MKQRKGKQRLNDWKLYGETEQPHKYRNELKDLVRQNIAAQIQLKTKCMIRQSHILSQEKQLAVCL